MWERKFDNYDQNVKNWEENKNKNFNLVFLNYPQDMKEHLLSMNGWTEANGEQDVIIMLVMIHSSCHKYDDTKQGTYFKNSDLSKNLLNLLPSSLLICRSVALLVETTPA